jgi:hypothetical protein
MSSKTDVEAIRLIGEEVVRLLNLSDEKLDEQAFGGLRLVADLAQWRDIAYRRESALQHNMRWLVR